MVIEDLNDFVAAVDFEDFNDCNEDLKDSVEDLIDSIEDLKEIGDSCDVGSGETDG